MTMQIGAFYHFQKLAQTAQGENDSSALEDLRARLESSGRELGIKGLVILAHEGINGTVAGTTREAIEAWLRFAERTLQSPALSPKWSEAEFLPFRRFGVRIREEIVTLGKPEVQPLPPKSETHLSPEEWNRALKEENTVVLDTRNWYETQIGTFKGAIDPKLNEFSEFDQYLEAAPLERDKKYLIFCTGGIRCEKAIVEMHNNGFKNVFQLDGGILNYLEKFPNQEFEGECFVFDHRVAIDQKLQPSQKYKLCPHCGQPGDLKIDCVRCEAPATICKACATEAHHQTCSKNCAHHALLKPGARGKHQFLSFEKR